LERRGFLGGSDARIIMGSDEADLVRLWREKRGEAEPEDLSAVLIVQLGSVTEDLNRRWYERNTGHAIKDVQRRVLHYDAQSSVERELVLRLASSLWRLRRATAIESGLFKIQVRRLLQLRQQRKGHQKRQKIIDSMYRNTIANDENMREHQDQPISDLAMASVTTVEPPDQSDDLTRSFVRLANLPTYPLDRLSRYEATLWRQTCQILFTLQCLDRRKPWERRRLG
jgi:hypothetical protein